MRETKFIACLYLVWGASFRRKDSSEWSLLGCPHALLTTGRLP